MKVLVTGADGFIGSHLVEKLIEEGFSVRAFTMYNSFNSRGWLDRVKSDRLENCEFFSGDIRDPNGVRAAVKGCDVVIHLAALIAIPFSYYSPDSYLETNVRGTLNILQACKELGVVRLVHTSTSEVYGTAQYVPIDELHPLQGQSPYSATKIAADQLVHSFYTSFDLPVVTIRPFNTYGPRQSARAVIPTVITQLLKGKAEIKIGSIHPTRDFNYIEDTVNGFVAAIGAQNINGEVINLGSNFEISIGEIIQLLSEVIGVDCTIKEEIQRIRPVKSEVERLWASNLKAKKMLDWQPSYSGKDGFRRGIEKTVEWFSNPYNLELYKVDNYNV